MDRQCEQEVNEFHTFLRDWLVGAVPRTEEEFARFAGVMGGGVEVISPLGTITERDALVSEFESLHAVLADDADAFRIWIENFRFRWIKGDHAMVTYEEWHQLGDDKSARLSTAFFRKEPSTPCGVVWLHVHETWLPDLAPQGGERFPEAGDD